MSIAKNHIRRRIQREASSAPGLVQFRIKSRRQGVAAQYHPSVCKSSGEVFCDCPGFQHHGHCWHSDRAILNATRHAEAPATVTLVCELCGDSADVVPIVDDITLQDLPGRYRCRGACKGDNAPISSDEVNEQPRVPANDQSAAGPNMRPDWVTRMVAAARLDAFDDIIDG